MSTWRIADGIAWVGDEGQVALIDTRASDNPPMIVPPEFAELWRALAESPRTESDLLANGETLVGEHAPDLVASFVADLSRIRVIEAVPSA